MPAASTHNIYLIIEMPNSFNVHKIIRLPIYFWSVLLSVHYEIDALSQILNLFSLKQRRRWYVNISLLIHYFESNFKSQFGNESYWKCLQCLCQFWAHLNRRFESVIYANAFFFNELTQIFSMIHIPSKEQLIQLELDQ